jgi:hypothetical protein
MFSSRLAVALWILAAAALIVPWALGARRRARALAGSTVESE